MIETPTVTGTRITREHRDRRPIGSHWEATGPHYSGARALMPPKTGLVDVIATRAGIAARRRHRQQGHHNRPPVHQPYRTTDRER
ncbi:hypothetical protein J8273_6018 [Carpediemonas membranifera]|uniref:Uncharacterized protein n=1 Tax=Carpediemonas membranifera TaxID=201153 RepID=A0A8J6E152_9EUKA|nr:hypothetical protein J8273_6018 [Carpediemonas membranifera]|eukprot:KAG9392651.1 hypothetical protein J8273_6018 [Carpediemonas membranifera]